MAGDTTGNQVPPAGSMFSLGWLMAQMYDPLLRRRGSNGQAHLPTVAELDPDSYADLEFLALEKLLAPFPGLSDADLKAAWNTDGHQGFRDAVATLHLKLLEQLAGDRQQLSAYQLGRALSDTCWLPDKDKGAEFFLREFDRYRLATLQSWLTEASGVLPHLSAATVSRSLQNWQDWADINASQITSGWATAYRSVVSALRNQASAWHALLGGESDISGETSADAWVLAGQSILRTTRLLVLTILRRFWLAVLVVAAATGGLLYLAAANTSGTAKVWTSLVTVAAAFGVSGASLRATALRAASGIEQDIRDTAALDARAWSVTWLPALPQNRRQRRHLANRGVAAPQVKKGLPSSEPQVPASAPQAPPAPVAPPLAAAGPAAG
jgi:hypothetical protein